MLDGRGERQLGEPGVAATSASLSERPLGASQGSQLGGQTPSLLASAVSAGCWGLRKLRDEGVGGWGEAAQGRRGSGTEVRGQAQEPPLH